MLAREVAADLLLLDELRGRELALGQCLTIMGTIRILRTAPNRGLIPTVTPLLEILRRREFRVSARLFEQIRGDEAAP